MDKLERVIEVSFKVIMWATILLSMYTRNYQLGILCVLVLTYFSLEDFKKVNVNVNLKDFKIDITKDRKPRRVSRDLAEEQP